MFPLLLLGLLIAATVQSYRLETRTASRVGEIFLRWVLVGYCGVPMLVVSVAVLAFPGRTAEMLPVGPPSTILGFFGWAYLGMSIMAVLALWYRGTALVGPAVCWAIYFFGATLVHLHGGGESGHGGVLVVLLAHLSISVILGVALLVSGVWRRGG